MRGKPLTSGERAIIFNVFKHLKGNFPLESQRSIIERTSKATITRCDLSPRFFCIDATLLCEFQSDKI